MHSTRSDVAIVYHFFAHYRKPVLTELLRHGKYRYVLAADNKDASTGIEGWDIEATGVFRHAPCIHLPRGVMIQRGLVSLALRRDLKAIIYLGNAAWPSTWVSAAIARLSGKRVLFWTHGWTHHERLLPSLIRRTFYRLAHGLLLYGHLAKMTGLRQRFPAENLYVIYNSLDYESQKAARQAVTPARQREVRKELFERPESPLLICASRLTASRRLDLLLIALSQLQADGHHVNLLLVGEGPAAAALQKQANELRLDVCFYGACYDESRLAELVMSSNATVVPSQLGLAAVQSLTFGTPVLANDDPEDHGPEWEVIQPGRTGDFFHQDDPSDLAEVIRRWTRTEFPSESVRHACHDVIDRFYNPVFQRVAIERALDGAPADDLFWQREPDRFA